MGASEKQITQKVTSNEGKLAQVAIEKKLFENCKSMIELMTSGEVEDIRKGRTTKREYDVGNGLKLEMFTQHNIDFSSLERMMPDISETYSILNVKLGGSVVFSCDDFVTNNPHHKCHRSISLYVPGSWERTVQPLTDSELAQIKMHKDLAEEMEIFKICEKAANSFGKYTEPSTGKYEHLLDLGDGLKIKHLDFEIAYLGSNLERLEEYGIADLPLIRNDIEYKSKINVLTVTYADAVVFKAATLWDDSDKNTREILAFNHHLGDLWVKDVDVLNELLESTGSYDEVHNLFKQLAAKTAIANKIYGPFGGHKSFAQIFDEHQNPLSKDCLRPSG